MIVKPVETNCHYCQRLLPRPHITKDHIVPRVKGGKNSPDNIVFADALCNSIKSAWPYERFVQFIASISPENLQKIRTFPLDEMMLVRGGSQSYRREVGYFAKLFNKWNLETEGEVPDILSERDAEFRLAFETRPRPIRPVKKPSPLARPVRPFSVRGKLTDFSHIPAGIPWWMY